MQTGKNPVWLLCKVSLCWVSSACFCRRKRTCFWSFTLVFDWQHVNSFTISLSLMLQIMGKKKQGLFSQTCCIFFGVKNLTDWQKRSHFRCSDCSDCSDLVHLAFCSWAGQTRLNFTMCRLASTGFNTGSSPVKSSPSTKNLSESARILKFSRNKEINVTQLTDQRKFNIPTLENHISWFLLLVLRWHPSTRAVTECSTHT